MSSNSSGSQNYGDDLLKEFNERFSAAKIRAIMQAALDAGYATMQDATPVKTGNLKASEGVSVVSDFEGEMHADASYAGFVNYGTSRQRPQPYFDRGVATATQKLKDGCASL